MIKDPKGIYGTNQAFSSLNVARDQIVQNDLTVIGTLTFDANNLANGYGDIKNPYAAKTANFVLAGPTTGAAAVPTFRALVAADIPGRGAPVTKTADFTLADTENWLINNKSGSTCVMTLPAASSWVGREVTIKNMQAQLVNSASSNVVPIDSTTAGATILLGVIGNWATLVSDGTNWVIMQAASNNNLLLE